MKKTIITAVLSIISATSIVAQDSLKPTEGKTGWLWEIRGNGIAQTCYLFGTCHGGGHSFSHEDVLGFSGVDEALKNVKTVYFETDLTVSMRLAAKEMSIAQYLGCDRDTTKEDMMPESVTYESLFDSVAQYQEVHQFLSQKMGAAAYWKKTPYYWFNHLSGYNLAKGYYGIQAVEGVLATEAVKRGIEIGQLESTEQHQKWLARPKTQRQRPNIELKFQATMLYMGIHNNDDKVPEAIREVAEGYLKNDTCVIHDVLERQAKDATIGKLAFPFAAMNNAWCPVIEQSFAQGACMVAVGARHLLGNDGLIVMLRKKGYSVEPIR